MRLILVRHGESEANHSGIAEGRSGDSPLTSLGHRQALDAALFIVGRFAPVAALYTSPQKRALATDTHISRVLRIEPLRVEALAEGSLGIWEGRPGNELDPTVFEDPHFRDHDGESPLELATRGAGALTQLAESHVDATIVAVSHGATICHSLAALFETTPISGSQYAITNAGITVLDWRASGPEVVLNGYRDHLREGA